MCCKVRYLCCQLLILWCFIIDMSTAVTTHGRKYTLYNEEHSWNEAKAICEEEGQKMPTFNSQKEQDILITFVQAWKAANFMSGGFWIGLADIDPTGPNFVFYWVHNDTYLGPWALPWHHSEPDMHGTEACVKSTMSGKFRTRDCSRQTYTICQEDNVPCWLDVLNDTMIPAPPSLQAEKEAIECMDMCLNVNWNGQECTSFVYAVKTCFIFLNSTYVHDLPATAPRVGVTTYIKRCYDGVYRNDTPSVAPNNASVAEIYTNFTTATQSPPSTTTTATTSAVQTTTTTATTITTATSTMSTSATPTTTTTTTTPTYFTSTTSTIAAASTSETTGYTTSTPLKSPTTTTTTQPPTTTPVITSTATTTAAASTTATTTTAKSTVSVTTTTASTPPTTTTTTVATTTTSATVTTTTTTTVATTTTTSTTATTTTTTTAATTPQPPTTTPVITSTATTTAAASTTATTTTAKSTASVTTTTASTPPPTTTTTTVATTTTSATVTTTTSTNVATTTTTPATSTTTTATTTTTTNITTETKQEEEYLHTCGVEGGDQNCNQRCVPFIGANSSRWLTTLKKMTLKKESLSSYIRARTSVPDMRTSAVSLGSTGIVVIVFVFGIIVLIDMLRYFESAERQKKAV